MQRVGVAGLERYVEVARFSRGGLGSWRDLRATLGWRRGEVFAGRVGVEVGLARRVGTASEQCHGESCAP